MPLHATTLALAALLGAAAPAAEVHPTAREVAALRAATGLALSPDGERLAWTVRDAAFDPAARPPEAFDPRKPGEADQKAGWKVTTQLWMAPAAGGPARQLTFGAEAVSEPAFSPDGATVGFLRKAEGKARLHLLSLAGGEARPLDTGALEPRAFAFSPDGRRVAFTAEAPPSAEEKRSAWESGGAVPWGHQWRPARLWVVDAAGGEPRAVTGPEVHVAAFRWSPDGRRFAAVLAGSSDPYEATLRLRPALVEIRAGGVAAPRWLDEEPRVVDGIEWSPDGRYVAWQTGVGALILNQLLVREADGTGRWNAAARLDPTLEGFAWSGDGRSLLVRVVARTGTRLYRLARDGASAADLGFAGRVASGPFLADRAGRRLAFLSSTPDEPADPTVFEVEARRTALVARLNPEVEAWPRGATEVVTWKSPEGPDIEGILTLPPGAPRDRPLPLMVFPHGGPDSVSQLGFSAFVRFFAARGWAVLRPNYRGGTGYGLDFYAANRGRLGEIELMDIESGVDALLARGRADPARLVYGGWSWGGYLTAWTIGHTSRYRAAVAGAAVVDVVTQYVLSDINHGAAAQWEFEGDPWRQWEHFDRANPLRHLQAVRTPTLVLHGLSDERVSFTASQVLYRALSDVGCEVELFAYPREPHGPREPAHLAHLLETWADWYQRHAGR